MTKEEKKQKTYGKYWNKWKEDINENGFLNTDLPLPNIMIKDLNLRAWLPNCWIPFSLIGIENNNGWIKIESKLDLPNERGNFYTIDRFYETNPCMEFFDPDNLVSMNERWVYRFTHYQPIIKPELPIY